MQLKALKRWLVLISLSKLGFTQDVTKNIDKDGKPLDVYFLADNTGSMQEEIEMVQERAKFIFNQLAAKTTEDIRFGVGAYRDFGDDFQFINYLELSVENTKVAIDEDPIVVALNRWSADGGGDKEEAQLYALYQIATESYEVVGWRENAVKLIVWFGDEPGHDPSGENADNKPITEKMVIEALKAQNIRVSAIDVKEMNLLGQATRIANQTGGSFAVYDREQEKFESILVSGMETAVEIEEYFNEFETGAESLPSDAFVDAIVQSVERVFSLG